MILGARLDDIGLWRKTGRAALYVMTAMALVSGFDYFRRFLKPLLAKEREEESARPRRPRGASARRARGAPRKTAL